MNLLLIIKLRIYYSKIVACILTQFHSDNSDMWSISGCLAIIHFEINKAMGADIHLDRMRGICIMTSSITARDKLLNGCSLQLRNT